MKLALDVWYALWEDVGNESGPDPDQPAHEKDSYYPWTEDYRAWIRDRQVRGDYQA